MRPAGAEDPAIGRGNPRKRAVGCYAPGHRRTSGKYRCRGRPGTDHPDARGCRIHCTPRSAQYGELRKPGRTPFARPGENTVRLLINMPDRTAMRGPTSSETAGRGYPLPRSAASKPRRGPVGPSFPPGTPADPDRLYSRALQNHSQAARRFREGSPAADQVRERDE